MTFISLLVEIFLMKLSFRTTSLQSMRLLLSEILLKLKIQQTLQTKNLMFVKQHDKDISDDVTAERTQNRQKQNPTFRGLNRIVEELESNS